MVEGLMNTNHIANYLKYIIDLRKLILKLSL